MTGAAGPAPVRVVLVDDQPLVLSGLTTILGSVPGIDVVGQAEDGAAGVDLVRRVRPDVVCMDVQMPRLDGLAATRQIVSDPDLTCAVVVLTTFRREDYLVSALQAGACGYVLKNARPEQLAAAVRAAASGDGLIAPELTPVIVRRALSGTAPAGRPPRTDLVVPLTDREGEVLALVAEGLSNDEIAERLVLGRATVKTHVSNLLLKLGVRDRVQAVVWAYRHGLAR